MQPLIFCIFSFAAEVHEDGKILIHFDGWSAGYDYWTDPTTSDIHPIGWFDQCGNKYPQYKQQLQPPKGKGIIITRLHGMHEMWIM